MQRPQIFEYEDPVCFFRDTLLWLKKTNKSFSLRKSTLHLQKCSPALLSLVLNRKRKLSLDRLADFSSVFQLNSREKRFLERTLKKLESKNVNAEIKEKVKQRGQAEGGLLSSWVNLYVKDACRLSNFKPNGFQISRLLMGLVSERQAEKSLIFLLKSGFLRRTLDGKIVENNSLVETSDEIPSAQVRAMHKKALEFARELLDVVPLHKREAATVLLPLSEKNFQVLKQKMKEWAEEIAEFAEENSSDNQILYQVVLNLSPVSAESNEVDKK